MHIAFFIIINDKLMIDIITLILWKILEKSKLKVRMYNKTVT